MDREPIIKQVETKKDWPKSFETEKGSIYTYDNEGKTTRFKTVTNEQNERQDITVFANLSVEDQQKFSFAIYGIRPENANKKVYILEREDDDSQRIIFKREDVKNPDRLYLGILENGQRFLNRKATLQPTIGYSVFDTKHFQKDGQLFIERHLGHKVTKINY